MSERPWIASYPNGVSTDPEIDATSVDQIVRDAARRFPGNPAVEFIGRRLTYAELDGLASSAAKGFQALGAGPGVKVGLYLPNCPQYPIAFFGALRAGATIVNYSPLDAAETLELKIADSETDILVTLDLAALYPQIATILDRTRVKHLVIGDLAEFSVHPLGVRAKLAEAKALAEVRPDPRHVRFSTLVDNDGVFAPPRPFDPRETVAALQYTGGTTGKPKGAMLTHANLVAAAEQFRETWRAEGRNVVEGGERFLVALPLFHIYALVVLLLAGFRIAAELVLHARFDPDAAVKDIETKRITVFPGVPTMFVAVLNHPSVKAESLRSLKVCGSGGAPLPFEVQAAFEAMSGCRLVEGWGMTETCSMGTFTPALAKPRPGSCGLPGPAVDMVFVSVDDPTKRVARGAHGEIGVKGPNIMKGYWNNEQATRDAFTSGGYLLTGDVGWMDADGYVHIVDRTKDMMLCGGFNVYPRNIEEGIYQHPAVEAVSVIGIADEYRGQSPKAFVKLKAGAEPMTLEEMKAFLKDRLGKHEMIAELEIRPDLPRTLVGKLSKRELYEEEARKRAG